MKEVTRLLKSTENQKGYKEAKRETLQLQSQIPWWEGKPKTDTN
jgi:hypothetical protein